MKNIMKIILIFSIVLNYSCEKEKDKIPIYKIGDFHEGGIIFYLDNSGLHGKVCAQNDQATNAEWYNGNYTLIGTTNTTVGSGYTNTVNIVNAYGSGDYAAQICNDLVLENYSDWYLPSRDELKLMYDNLKLGGFSTFTQDLYWSSSEFKYNTAFFYDFANGSTYSWGDKSLNGYVRAVRNF